MNRTERDSFTASTDQSDLAFGESACLETPPDLYAVLNAEFHFDVDLTANNLNAKHPVHFGPGGIQPDALTADWTHATRRVGFSNPPYGAFVKLILEKARNERQLGFTSVFLLPMRASRWYTNLVLGFADEVRHIDRLKFWYQGQPKLNPKNGAHETALFDSIIVIFRPYVVKRHLGIGSQGCPHVSYWKWQAALPALTMSSSQEQPDGTPTP